MAIFYVNQGYLVAPFITTGCWIKFFYFYQWEALPLTQPIASKHWRTNKHKVLQATGYPACHPINSDNTLKAQKVAVR